QVTTTSGLLVSAHHPAISPLPVLPYCRSTIIVTFFMSWPLWSVAFGVDRHFFLCKRAEHFVSRYVDRPHPLVRVAVLDPRTFTKPKRRYPLVEHTGAGHGYLRLISSGPIGVGFPQSRLIHYLRPVRLAVYLVVNIRNPKSSRVHDVGNPSRQAVVY